MNMKCEKIKICYKHIKGDLISLASIRNSFSSSELSYLFIQTDAKIRFFIKKV